MSQEQQTGPVASAPTSTREHGNESIAELIRSLATDLSTLLSKELELAKAEVGDSISEAKTAVGSLLAGGAVAMAGLVVVLMSAVYGLGNLDVIAPWLAALIVGAAALLIGFMLVASAKKKMSANAMVPDRTLASANKDKETLKRATR